MINSNKSFFDFLDQYAAPDPGKRRIYRGEPCASYKLTPGIERQKSPAGVAFTEKDEDLLFRHFKERACPYLDRHYGNLSLWALAQHYRLPTRLLDWSRNPLIAAYFAVEHATDRPHKPSAIHVLENYPEPRISHNFSIKVTEVTVFAPAYLDARIVNQRGLFTVHPYPWAPLTAAALPGALLTKVCISWNYRRKLRKLLNVLGVNESIIYPGMEGVAKHLRWMKTDTW